MARRAHPTWQEEDSGFSPNGRPSPRRRCSSRGFFAGIAAVVLLALAVAVGGAIAAQSASDGASGQDGASLADGAFGPTVAPRAAPTGGQSPARPDIQVAAAVATPEGSSSGVQSPATAASSWSAGPAPAEPAPAPPTASGAAGLAAQANETYGVRIVMEGQDWGEGEAAQEANVQAVISAISRLPSTVISAVVAHAHGPLTFVSNNQGRTLDGWQPYGGHPMAYYTNSDQGPAGYRASNQVVLSAGAAGMSIGHEILHSYQFRNVGPDQYALALLQPEMRSFMDAVGWRQTGSDEEVRQAVNQPWSTLNALYGYGGRALTYTTASGGTGTMAAANPVEAFAIAGSVYYTRPSWMPLPDWPEYWAWFRANVG